MATLTKTRTLTQPPEQALDPALTSTVPSPFPRDLLHAGNSRPDIRIEAAEAEAGPSRTVQATESTSTMVQVGPFGLHSLPHLMPYAAGTHALHRLRRKDMSHDAQQHTFG